FAVARFVESSPRSVASEPAAPRPEPAHAAATVLDSTVESSASPQVAAQRSPDRRKPEGIWIRGRVKIPAELPPDDHIEGAARCWSLEDDSAGVSTVDEEGRFLVASPADGEEGWLELRSRYLYPEQEFDVDLEDLPAEVVLEPALGGCVRGRFVPSQPAKD